MEKILWTLLIGTVAGVIDILPMIKMKLDRYAILSAFTFYFIMPFIIFNITFIENSWWVKGGIITLGLALPTIILATKEKKTNAIPISIMAFVLGTIIGIVGHFIGIM